LVFEEDRNLIDHKSSLTESLLHVPFTIVNPPEGFSLDYEEGRFLSHLELGDIVKGIINEESVNVFRDEIPAELIGIGTTTGSLEGEQYEYWNRAIRAFYEKDQKKVWDSQGKSEAFRIDLNRSCWQENLGEANIEEEDKKFFDIGIEKFKKEVETGNHNIDEITKKRLAALGYD
jgi:hypothetical protein